MSLHVKAAMLASKDLPKTDRLVVLAIAAHTNKAGDAWPSVATIAEYVGVSERTVQRALARLVAAGRLVWRHVAGIATRVYRIVVQAAEGVASAAKRVTSGAAEVTDSPLRGDTPPRDVSPDVDEGLKDEAPARVNGRLDWRRYIPGQRSSNPNRPQQSYPERRGAALPPPPGGDRCPEHPGQLAHNCGPCRSEALAGAR